MKKYGGENNLIMPKGDGTVEAFDNSIDIYYELFEKGEEWVTNREFKPLIAERLELPEDSNGPFLIKKSELARYFGFIEYQDWKRRGRITERGKKYYNAHVNLDYKTKIELLFQSLTNDTFGRNNCAVPGSDSIIEPPIILLKAIYELNYIKKEEFAYLLYLMHDLSFDFGKAINEVQQGRENGVDFHTKKLKSKFNKYNDIKFLVYFKYIGILTVNDDGAYFVSNYINDNYAGIIKNMTVYNINYRPIQVDMTESEYEELHEKLDSRQALDYIESEYEQNRIWRVAPYDKKSEELNIQNNRKPEYKETSIGKRYRTNARIAKTAIGISNYKCLNSSSHYTFEGKNKLPYLEAHHIIPMAAQVDFGDKNIDRVENIAALCPTCHRAIHYGSDNVRKDVLRNIFSKRSKELQDAGIFITFDELFDKYYK